jgi:quercetin dioxygenase-like cupin family protein
MKNSEVDKGKVLNNIDILEYVTDSIVTKTVLKRITGNISAFSFDAGKTLAEKRIPFDNFLQIIEGEGEIIIDGLSNILLEGQSIIVPAHSLSIIRSNTRFKMISTIIKSGYE